MARNRLRAEYEADTAIAVKRAEVRMAREVEEAEPVERLALPAAQPQPEPEPAETANLPAIVERGEIEPSPSSVARREPGPLDALPGPLPQLARAVTGVVRPLLPERVTNFQANPVKTARTLLEEVEEFTFSLTRRRKVTVESNEPEAHEQARAAEPVALRQSAVASRILDSAGEHRDVLTQDAEERRALPLGEQRPELAAGDAAGELASAARRDLPPGRD